MFLEKKKTEGNEVNLDERGTLSWVFRPLFFTQKYSLSSLDTSLNEFVNFFLSAKIFNSKFKNVHVQIDFTAKTRKNKFSPR